MVVYLFLCVCAHFQSHKILFTRFQRGCFHFALHLTAHCIKARLNAKMRANNYKQVKVLDDKKKSTNCASTVRIARRKNGASTSKSIGNAMILNDPMTPCKKSKRNYWLRKYFHIACSSKIIHQITKYKTVSRISITKWLKMNEKKRRIHHCLLNKSIHIGCRAGCFFFLMSSDSSVFLKCFLFIDRKARQ